MYNQTRLARTIGHWMLLIATMALLPAMLGCNPAYYAGSVGGHLKIVSSSQPVDRLIERKDIDPGLRQRLETSVQIREFATEQLGLPDNSSSASLTSLLCRA